MKTDIVNNLANDPINQLENYEKQYGYNRTPNKVLLKILFILLVIHVYHYLKPLKSFYLVFYKKIIDFILKFIILMYFV